MYIVKYDIFSNLGKVKFKINTVKNLVAPTAALLHTTSLNWHGGEMGVVLYNSFLIHHCNRL